MRQKYTKYLIVLFILALLSTNVFASGFSLSVKSPHPVDIYKIGQIEDKTIKYNDKFKDYQIDSDMNNDVNEIANALYGYILRDNIPSDDKGLEFTVDKGVYLLMHEPIEKDGKKYTFTPTLVYVNIDTSIEMKHEYIPLEKPKEDPEEPKDVSKEDPKEEPKSPEKEETGSIEKDNSEKDNYMVVLCKKEWEGKIGKKILVQLLKNDEVISEKVLDRSNRFSYEWRNLEKDAYTVVEKDVPSGFTTKTLRNGSEFTIKNTSKEESNPIIAAVQKVNKIIKTSDPAYLMLAFTLFVIAGSIIAARPSRKEKNK